jgi:hypothetical protein
MANVVFVIKADIPEEDVNAVWADPADYLIAGLGQYFGSSDVSVYRIGDAKVDFDELD